MVKPLNFSTLSDSQSWTGGERRSLLVEGSRLFPPLRKLFRHFARTQSPETQNLKQTAERQSSPSLVETLPAAKRRSFKSFKSEKYFVEPSFGGDLSLVDLSPVDLSSCSPGMMAADLRQRYWPPVHSSSTKRLNRIHLYQIKSNR
jgi:hypothetical protein